jgi:putative transposase
MQSFARISIHVVFSTKNREPLILPDREDRLYGVIGGILRADKCVLLCAGGVEDHVHLLVSMARDLSASDAVRNIKTGSCKWVHENIAGAADFEWQRGYAAFSVSRSNEDAVRTYFRGQKEHHRKQNYQDEFRRLLALHDIEPDEEYMWD